MGRSKKKERGDAVSIVFPADWDIKQLAKKRSFGSIQDYVRELVRRDKEQK